MTAQRVDGVKLPPDDIEGHTLTLYATSRRAWGICACEWRSSDMEDVPGVQWEWANHIAALVERRT